MSGDQKEPKIGGRTLRARPGVITSLRVEKGWSIEQLAKESRRSTQTIGNVENGKPAYLATLRAIAEALDVKVGELLVDGEMTLASPPPEGFSLRVELFLSLPWEHFDETSDLTQFLKQLFVLTQTHGSVVVESVQRGSVAITLGFDEIADVRSLIQISCELNLDKLHVHVIAIQSYEGIESDLARYLWRSTPGTILPFPPFGIHGPDTWYGPAGYYSTELAFREGIRSLKMNPARDNRILTKYPERGGGVIREIAYLPDRDRWLLRNQRQSSPHANLRDDLERWWKRSDGEDSGSGKSGGAGQ
ncbi:helix-turn-helix transcriptional regulator [Tautonia sp. JC769]|uniref:helix-turn-helix domain-containing protein n=1 Tax=Tautonia sp. JC769 TaxID=3232135 RepID=UPI00345802E0